MTRSRMTVSPGHPSRRRVKRCRYCTYTPCACDMLDLGLEIRQVSPRMIIGTIRDGGES